MSVERKDPDSGEAVGGDLFRRASPEYLFFATETPGKIESGEGVIRLGFGLAMISGLEPNLVIVRLMPRTNADAARLLLVSGNAADPDEGNRLTPLRWLASHSHQAPFQIRRPAHVGPVGAVVRGTSSIALGRFGSATAIASEGGQLEYGFVKELTLSSSEERAGPAEECERCVAELNAEVIELNAIIRLR